MEWELDYAEADTLCGDGIFFADCEGICKEE